MTELNNPSHYKTLTIDEKQVISQWIAENIHPADREYNINKKKKIRYCLVYDSLKQVQQNTWEQRYILGWFDTDVYPRFRPYRPNVLNVLSVKA